MSTQNVVGPKDSGLFEKVLRRAGEAGVYMYRIPALVTTKGGSLVAAFDIRYKTDVDLPGEIDIGGMRSTDGGETWSEMKVLMGFDKSERGAMGNGVGDPCLLSDMVTGTVWVSGLWVKGNRSWEGSGPGYSPEESGQWLLARSDDDGVTWSEPINITRQGKKEGWAMAMQGPGRGIQLRDGTLVFPAHFAVGKERHSFFVYSADHGESWKSVPASVTATDFQSDESQIVELADGGLLLSMNGRDALKKRVWVKYSRNDGTGKIEGGSWGEPWRELDDPGCQGSILSPVDSRWILSSNPASVVKREKLTVCMSTDGGVTWPVKRLLADGGWCAYSCMTILPDGAIGILYEYSVAPVVRDTRFEEIRWTVGETRLTFARFTVDWVMGERA